MLNNGEESDNLETMSPLFLCTLCLGLELGPPLAGAGIPVVGACKTQRPVSLGLLVFLGDGTFLENGILAQGVDNRENRAERDLSGSGKVVAG